LKLLYLIVSQATTRWV